MSLLSSILFWAGILMLSDGALALLFEEKWQKMARGMNIRGIAVVEIATALLLLTMHYLL